MKGIFSVLVENKAGVLSKTAGLFARRGFNIDSLAVGETDDRDISSMTIISMMPNGCISLINRSIFDVLAVSSMTMDFGERSAIWAPVILQISIISDLVTFVYVTFSIRSSLVTHLFSAKPPDYLPEEVLTSTVLL